jgi:nickel transport protein
MFLLALALPAQAHKLKVFAQADGSLIEGRAYFVGGVKARGAVIHIKTPAGELLAEVTADADGHFSYRADRAVDLVIEADSGDGHLASWPIKAQALAPAFANPAPHTPVDQARAHQTLATPTGAGDEASSTSHAASSLSIAELELAVARQIAPLREELAAERDARRLQDILGGLGYICGLFGLAFWWKGRS